MVELDYRPNLQIILEETNMFELLNPFLVQGVLLVVVVALLFAATAVAAYIASNERLRGLVARWEMVDELVFDLVTTAAGIDINLSEYEEAAEAVNLDPRMYYVIDRGMDLANAQFGLSIDFWALHARATRIYHELVADPQSPVE